MSPGERSDALAASKQCVPQNPAPQRGAPRRAARVCIVPAPASAVLPRQPQAQDAGQRVALVTGEGAYKVAPLSNPISDANAVSASPRQFGFSDTQRENTELRELIEELRAHLPCAQKDPVHVFFDAGHGIKAENRNCLIVVDVDRAAPTICP